MPTTCSEGWVSAAAADPLPLAGRVDFDRTFEDFCRGLFILRFFSGPLSPSVPRPLIVYRIPRFDKRIFTSAARFAARMHHSDIAFCTDLRLV
jgi:hypothetical protein